MKVLLSALISLALAIICTIFIVMTLFIQYIEDEELRVVEENRQHTLSMFYREELGLENTQLDWANWDDSYDFMNGSNKDFVEVNLQPATLEALKLNFMVFIDRDFNVINALVKGLEPDSGDGRIKELAERIKENRYFEKEFEWRPVTGITIFHGKPMFISVSPVMDTNRTKRGNGYLLIGRYVEESFISYMEEVLSLEIIPAAKNFYMAEDDLKIVKYRNVIRSYISIKDILSAKSFIFIFDQKRDLYNNGMDAIQYFGIVYLFALLIVAGICVYVFDVLVTQRINNLHRFIDNVAESKDTTARLVVRGKDEISRLADNMNIMLGELGSSYNEIKKKEERFRLTMEATNDGYFDINLTEDQIYVSMLWLNYMGYGDEDEYISMQDLLDNIYQEDRNVFKNAYEQYIKGETDRFKVEFRVLKKSGEFLWIMARGKIVEYDENGKPLRMIGNILDINERKLFEARNVYLSQTDPVTNLKNRAFMEELLKNMEQCGECNGWLIMGDVNGLKIVNDSLGHQKGDNLLTAVGEVIVKNCTESDIPARWGGDEFLILVRDQNMSYIENLMQNIKSGCEMIKDFPYKISIALGYANKDDKHSDTDSVLKLAEERMYRNKLLQSRSARSAIISSLKQSLHEKHIETEEHTRRIQNLCLKIGEYLGLSQEELDELALLGVLHDIGKIAIPETVLLKKGTLNAEEWDIMKTHTEIGYRIAASTPELAHIAYEILYHHEKYDGTGYPHGLNGKEIPKLSRLLSIVDAFDVMTHDRVYKKAVSLESAVFELETCSGKQFDPDMVEIFLRLLKEGEF